MAIPTSRRPLTTALHIDNHKPIKYHNNPRTLSQTVPKTTIRGEREMCEKIHEHFIYQCQHPGTPTYTWNRCEHARHQYAWGTCVDFSSSHLEPPTMISAPCAPCKAAGGWQDYYDLKGRLRWRPERDAIQPRSKKA